MIIALVVIVAIAGVGIFVYKHHQDSSKSMNSMGNLTSKPILGSAAKGSSVNVNGKSLGSIIPQASALNLSHIATSGFGWDIYACRTYIPVYGGVYAIQAFYYKPVQVGAKSFIDEYATTTVPVTSIGKTSIQSQSSSSYFDNVVSELKENVSVLNSSYTVDFSEISNGGAIQFGNTFTVSGIGKYLVSC